jgi:predicted dehydrogenase
MPEGESLRYPDAGMLSMLAQFQQALTTGKAPETSGADNLWTLAMFEAAVQSAQSGRYVSIDEIFTPELRARAGIAEES